MNKNIIFIVLILGFVLSGCSSSINDFNEYINKCLWIKNNQILAI